MTEAGKCQPPDRVAYTVSLELAQLGPATDGPRAIDLSPRINIVDDAAVLNPRWARKLGPGGPGSRKEA